MQDKGICPNHAEKFVLKDFLAVERVFSTPRGKNRRSFVNISTEQQYFDFYNLVSSYNIEVQLRWQSVRLFDLLSPLLCFTKVYVSSNHIAGNTAHGTFWASVHTKLSNAMIPLKRHYLPSYSWFRISISQAFHICWSPKRHIKVT